MDDLFKTARRGLDIGSQITVLVRETGSEYVEHQSRGGDRLNTRVLWILRPGCEPKDKGQGMSDQ